MSHIVKVKAIEVKDEAALRAAVQRTEGASFVNDGVKKVHQMYGSQKADGIGVNLKGWRMPAVFNLETKEVKYDNFNGSWGPQSELDDLIHEYTVEATKNAAIADDPTVYVEEEVLENGDTKVVLEYA